MPEIKPQPGFQQKFLSSVADITIGGGNAGGGKSWALLVAPLRHRDIRNFTCNTFRRTTEEIKNPGGLWDKAVDLYQPFGLRGYEQGLKWLDRSLNLTLKFSHLQHEKNIYDHDGAEYALICFDELQHFSKKQFFYLLGRNRSTCGVAPYCLATCNPDPDSFLADFLAWWIDQDEKLPNGNPNPNWGFPIKERDGIVRFLYIHEDQYIWGDSRQEIVDKYYDLFFEAISNGQDPKRLIKSVTFIAGNVFENKILLDSNPGYLANLNSLDEVEKARLLYGNWKIRAKDDALIKNTALDDAFDNPHPDLSDKSYITCDAARFGDDLCTIYTWRGFAAVKLDIWTKSSKDDIIRTIEKRRNEFGVLKSNCLVDQDGVGGGAVKDGKYVGFSGGVKPMPVVEIKGKKIENYFNLKAQLAYRYAERFNEAGIAFRFNSEDSIYVDGQHGTKIKLDGTTYDVRDLIKLHYRAIRRAGEDMEKKKRINDKMDQRRILKGWSPDLFDGSFLREYFALTSTGIRVGTPTKSTSGSILDRL